MTDNQIAQLQHIARLIRIDVIRMCQKAGSAHPGPALSATDLIAALYFKVMNVDPHHPQNPDRDRFVLSKGHGYAALYSALARKGYFPSSHLGTLRTIGSILQGHPDMAKTPGIDLTTGSLGNGICGAVGIALGARMDRKSYRTFTILGDGECQEGAVWEAAMLAGHHKLDNIVALVDRNGFQSGGALDEIMKIDPLVEKWQAFGWEAIIIDGHHMPDIIDAFSKAAEIKAKPAVIIAHTIKGKGVSFMENNNTWHMGNITNAQMATALCELGLKEEDINW